MPVLPGIASSVSCLAVVCPRRMFMYFCVSVCLQVDLDLKLLPFEDLLLSYRDVVLGKDQSIA